MELILQMIGYLKDFAYFVRDNLEYYTDIKISTLKTEKEKLFKLNLHLIFTKLIYI